MRFPYIKFILPNQFQTTFVRGGGGGDPFVEVTLNSKEENSEDFCPNYVHEFGLCINLKDNCIHVHILYIYRGKIWLRGGGGGLATLLSVYYQCILQGSLGRYD